MKERDSIATFVGGMVVVLAVHGWLQLTAAGGQEAILEAMDADGPSSAALPLPARLPDWSSMPWSAVGSPAAQAEARGRARLLLRCLLTPPRFAGHEAECHPMDGARWLRSRSLQRTLAGPRLQFLSRPHCHLFQSMPAFLLPEVAVCALALVGLWHAMEPGERGQRLALWLGSLLGGTANDVFFMFLPVGGPSRRRCQTGRRVDCRCLPLRGLRATVPQNIPRCHPWKAATEPSLSPPPQSKYTRQR